MIIHPQIQGCVARNCHPMGCRAAVLQQILGRDDDALAGGNPGGTGDDADADGLRHG